MRAALLAILIASPTFAQHHDHKPAPAPRKQAQPALKTEHKSEPKTEPKAETKPEVKLDAISVPAAPVPAQPAPVNADEALKRLQEGNQRWASGKSSNPRTDSARVKTQGENGQTPFAAILTCADSRLPVERIFDQGVGDLFDVRIAGNIAGDHQTGSLEYSAHHLHIPLLVVMGHTKCGAVHAAATEAQTDGNIPTLIREIAPAVQRARSQNPNLKGEDILPHAVKENVWQSVFTMLRTSATLRERIHNGQLKVVGAVYNVTDGSIEWMGEHPWQSELLAAFATPAPAATASHPDSH